jgi:TolB-like protein/thioredoxin-like negative regulator of GroEL
MSLIAELKQRKLVQWAVAYAAAAFALVQGVDIVAQRFDWPESIERMLIIAAFVGFFVTLLLAWYHGERGAQKVSGTELLLLALLLGIGGGLLWKFAPNPPAPVHIDAPARMPATAAAIDSKSIAVLPFVNMSGDAKDDYFSDGITEEILHALAQVPGLEVAGRTSTFAFKGKAQDLRKVGGALGVAVVLEGSVQKSGDDVRITAQLIDVRSGFHLWSAKYDRKLTNIFEVEDEISRAIAAKLQEQLADGGLTRKPVDPRAHDFYLRGLNLLAARGPGLRDAVAAFKSAVEIAPDYAQAWGAMAQAEALYPNYGLGSMKEAFPRALASAQHALALNPDTASAHVAQGTVFSSQKQWAKADAAFGRALALAPGDAEMATLYAQFLLITGNFEQALAEIERAQKLDPLSPVNGIVRGQVLSVLHRNDEAWAQSQRNVTAFPEFAKTQADAARTAMAVHRWSDAERHARKYGALVGVDAGALVQIIDSLHGIAEPARHESTAMRLKTMPFWLSVRGSDPWTYAMWLCRLDDCKAALPVLEQAAAQDSDLESEFVWDPVFDPLREDPRFKAVLVKMGLPYTPTSIRSP